jgi:hypothetical protein
MQATQIPSYFAMPFGKNAGAGYIRTIPTNSQIGIVNGAASLNDGFPPMCFQDVNTGGVPPFGQDFNGILNQTSAGVQWIQAGGLAVFNNAFSNAIGGYPNGAILVKANGTGFWRSTADNNFSNPDGATPTNWVDMLAIYIKADGNTYAISITGNAATATNAANATNATNAQNATNATHATTANSATTAGTANNSNTAPIGDISTAIANTAFCSQNFFGSSGQTWQVVTGSRSIGIAYTNSTGRPIEVSVASHNNGPGNGGAIKAFVNGVQVGYAANYNFLYPNWLSFIVPPGGIYQVNNAGGGTSQALDSWSELR